MDIKQQNPWAMTNMDLDGVKAKVEKKMEFGRANRTEALAAVKEELDMSDTDMQALEIFMGPENPVMHTRPRWRLTGKPGGIIEDRKIQLDAALDNGYKIATYTYATAVKQDEMDKEYWALFDLDDLSTGYTCEIWDLTTGRWVLEKEADAPHAARTAAMAAYAEKLLGDTVSHNLGESAMSGVYALSIAEAATTGMPLTGDLPSVIKGGVLKKWLLKKKLSQNKAAELCSVNPRTFRRWVGDSPPIPRGMFELLRLKTESLTP
jgi:hypothetical protein